MSKATQAQDARVLLLLRDGQWHPRAEVEGAAGTVGVSLVMKRLRRQGHPIETEMTLGLWRWENGRYRLIGVG